MMAVCTGIVQSHTIIRVPGKAHAAKAPFVLVLVALDDGRRVLGHFRNGGPPRIGARVVADGPEHETLIFRILEE